MPIQAFVIFLLRRAKNNAFSSDIPFSSFFLVSLFRFSAFATDNKDEDLVLRKGFLVVSVGSAVSSVVVVVVVVGVVASFVEGEFKLMAGTTRLACDEDVVEVVVVVVVRKVASRFACRMSSRLLAFSASFESLSSDAVSLVSR